MTVTDVTPYRRNEIKAVLNNQDYDIQKKNNHYICTMKNTLKFLYVLSISCLPVFAYGAGNYQAELKKLNDYFKTFDNGFYGYFEVKDGYLYDRFSSGKYTKTPVDQLGDVSVAEANRKVIINCKTGTDCTYSTYTDSYHAYLQFSQSADFNTGELITLFNNLISALQGNSSFSQNTASSERLQKQQERLKYPGPAKYTKQLDALNTYLKTFNPETYGDVTVTDGKVYFKFIVGSKDYYSSISISDLVQNTSVLYLTDEIKISCKDNSRCFYSSYLNNNPDHFRFFSKTVKDLTKMKQLAEEFINALK